MIQYELAVMGRSPQAKLAMIRAGIVETGLDLSGLTVLTELGSGEFVLAPLVASLGGAERVIAWTRDSKYGTADANVKAFSSLSKGVKQCDVVEIRENIRPWEDVTAADIITNSGMVRPLDAEFLYFVRTGKTVIPLMYEAWEVRANEVDLDVCRQRMIAVCGVNESDPAFAIFNYIRPLAIKMALNAGYEILGNKILVWSNDAFGTEVAAAFSAMNAREVVLTNDWATASAALPNLDFVFIADYDEMRPYLGASGLFSLHDVAAIAPNVGFVHLYGALNISSAVEAGHNVYPLIDGSAQVMSVTLADVGPLPVIRLMTAGLRAAQEILRGETLRFAQPLRVL